ncbi:hypothetical protein K5549_004057 [Capra hircus]|nr:hypothetical protein K5549_004057 [Capra hircus]
MQTSQKDFNKAVSQLKLLKEDPGNEVKLKLYALYKQATEGPCNVPKPGMLDFINKTKWDAWNALGSLSKEAARQNYVDLVSKLSASSESPSPEAPEADRKQPESDSLVVTSEDGITTIRLNRPTKKNALTTQMYHDVIAALQAASKDESAITVLTVRPAGLSALVPASAKPLPEPPDGIGAPLRLASLRGPAALVRPRVRSGDYFCSGNDLTNFTTLPAGGPEEMARRSAVVLR